MKIIVTGAAGFIGYHLCKSLLAEGHQVIGIDSYTDDSPIVIKEGHIKELRGFNSFEFVKLDVTNDGFRTLFNGQEVDYFVHLAGRDLYEKTWIDYSPFIETNVVGTAKMLELAKLLKVKKFVLSSTHSVYGNTKRDPISEEKTIPRPVSPHGVSKLAAENIAYTMSQLFKVPIAVLRIFSVYGPSMRPYTLIPNTINNLKEGKDIKLYVGSKERRDYIYIDDVVNYIKRAFNVDGKFQIINVASGNAITLAELVFKIAEIMGKDASKVTPSYSPQSFSKVVDRYNRVNVARAKRLLKYLPQVSLDEGLKKTVAWYLAHSDILKLSAS